MKNIYANLLGKWVRLTETDTIFNDNAYTWINEHVLDEYTFVWIGHGYVGYKIHVSQIQITSSEDLTTRTK